MTKNATAKGLSVEQPAKDDADRPRKKVQRHSPDRLLRKPIALPGGVTVSSEKHRGRLVVRIESPNIER